MAWNARPLQGAADLHDERDAHQQDFRIGETVEVPESSHAAFDRIEQGWVGTTPSNLPRPEHDNEGPWALPQGSRRLTAWDRGAGRPCRRR